MTARFFFFYAWRSILRHGQRSALAVVCVAFGVLSLVALQQLAGIMTASLLVPPRVAQGGDARLTREDGPISGSQLARVDSLGVAVSPIARPRLVLMKTATSGRVTLLTQVVGVDPDRYPLYGAFHIRTPRGDTLPNALAEIGSAVITRDLADRLGIAIGESISLFGSPETPPFGLVVRGVADRTPDRRGGSVFVGLSTLGALGIPNPTDVFLKHEDVERVRPVLESAGWVVTAIAERSDDDAAKTMTVMLAGAGILGLLVGGIGVANTIHVLLARRTTEIATLKAIGYRQTHLIALFGSELLLLGTLGSLVGVLLGVGLSYGLMRALNASLPFLLTFDLRASVLTGGVVVGVATTLIFGVVAVVRAGQVRPSVLIRGESARLEGTRRAATVALYASLFVAFGFLSGIVLGSWWKGFVVVAGGLIGLAVIGAILGGVLRLIVRLPVPGLPLLRMAHRNLRHQSARLVYGLVALFVGVVAIGSATISLYNALERREGQSYDLTGVNVRVFGSDADEARLRRTLEDFGVRRCFVDYPVVARVRTAADTLRALDVTGRREADIAWDVRVVDSLDVTPGESAFVSDVAANRYGLAPGDTLVLWNEHATERLRVAATFTIDSDGPNLGGAPRGLIVSKAVSDRLRAVPAGIRLSVAVDPKAIAELSDALGRAAPRSVVIDKDAIHEAISGLLRAFFWFVAAIAGLALVAGAVLIANAVGLSMLERRRELGVLKAIGYSSRQVLVTVLLENALLGLLAGIAGVVGLYVGVLITNRLAPEAHLTLTSGQSIALIGVSVALAIGSACLVAWKPTRLRPLVVLRGD